MAKTSPAQLVREVRQELAKVTWPSRQEVLTATLGVIAMSGLMALFFFLVDTLIAWTVQWLLGLGG